MTAMPKHLFFDLDETLTPSRSMMLSAHVPLFEAICRIRDVIVVSGAQESQMSKQLPPQTEDCTYFMLTQNGNHAIAPDRSVLWSERFKSDQTALVLEFIRLIHDELALSVSNEADLVEIRGSQISYSLVGHNERLEVKKAFDPHGSKRREILARRFSDVQKLTENGIEITVGGTTCLDIYLLGKNKGFHVPRLIEQMAWQKNDSLYFGDALEPGRNDESVIGVIPTQAVSGPDETFESIAKMLS